MANQRRNCNAIIDAINDDELAEKVAAACRPRQHDVRCCLVCGSNGNEIEAYRAMLLEVINRENVTT